MSKKELELWGMFVDRPETPKKTTVIRETDNTGYLCTTYDFAESYGLQLSRVDSYLINIHGEVDLNRAPRGSDTPSWFLVDMGEITDEWIGQHKLYLCFKSLGEATLTKERLTDLLLAQFPFSDHEESVIQLTPRLQDQQAALRA